MNGWLVFFAVLLIYIPLNKKIITLRQELTTLKKQQQQFLKYIQEKGFNPNQAAPTPPQHDNTATAHSNESTDTQISNISNDVLTKQLKGQPLSTEPTQTLSTRQSSDKNTPSPATKNLKPHSMPLSNSQATSALQPKRPLCKQTNLLPSRLH